MVALASVDLCVVSPGWLEGRTRGLALGDEAGHRQQKGAALVSDTQAMSGIDEQGNPVLIEYVYYRHFAVYRQEVDSIEEALSAIQYGADDGQMASVGVFVNGEPRIWDGYVRQDPPTPEQAEEMRAEYAKAEAL